jgi:ABC-type transport system involved in Fe-S cluster assembly fused permease/ATPase subunit
MKDALKEPLKELLHKGHAMTTTAVPMQRLWGLVASYRGRVVAALVCLIAAKLCNLGVPILLGRLVGSLTTSSPHPEQIGGLIGLSLVISYGVLRFCASLFSELREMLFAKAIGDISRSLATQVFAHLHRLSLRFHLERQIGAVTRDIERGVHAIRSLVNYALYHVVPTLLEVTLVLIFLGWRLDWWFSVMTALALGAYIAFTLTVTHWRTPFRRQMNQLESLANQKAVDALLNYETVKYFGTESQETHRYDDSLRAYEKVALKSQYSLSFLNLGQQLIIAGSMVVMLGHTYQQVQNGQLAIGDLVMVNAFLIQLYMPLNFLGVVYREIRQSWHDLERLFGLLDAPQEVQDSPDAMVFPETERLQAPAIRFDQVSFAYQADRPILHRVSFEIPAGHTVAVVGPSGGGKSTLVRLLFRFYEPTQGRIQVNGQAIDHFTQSSWRAQLGIVPQDCVLLNDRLGYNIAYGHPQATAEQIDEAARVAHIDRFIRQLPQGYDTMVGERGLKLSGGEKQRVAIARAWLKSPLIWVLDEATSALDSANERAIQQELTGLSAGKTTLIIAHRLSTIVHAHEILVLDAGRIVERGTHPQLLAQAGLYQRMWSIQQNHTAQS